MSIRFNCTACQTVLKIGEAISEPKKVRCMECGIVILLTPDEDSPIGFTTSVPEKPDKTTSRSKEELARQRFLLLGGVAVLAVVLALGLWWLFSGPSDRAAIEGEVSLDSGPLERGWITFVAEDDPKKSVMIGIMRGRYSVGASRGPFIGNNKVEIRGDEGFTVAARFNSQSEIKRPINSGLNTYNFDVRSK